MTAKTVIFRSRDGQHYVVSSEKPLTKEYESHLICRNELNFPLQILEANNSDNGDISALKVKYAHYDDDDQDRSIDIYRSMF